jgi:hypothetical protein
MTILVVLAALLAFVQVFGLSAKMESLRQQGQSGGEAFTRLHHWSTRQYTVQAILVIGALCFLPAAIARQNDRCATGTSPGSIQA